ncbi:MAG: DEAD/DEAH box helicase [Burkholderiales bacterium]|nr:DEAD/DEAH box helicase [Burkholderiales bacterium]
MSLHNENAAVELQSPDFVADEAVVESSQETSGFAVLNLNASLLKAVDALGYTEPTAVQAETIPAALAGGDWMVSSQTGSGKTAAFLLPALQVLLDTPPMPKGEQIARSRRAGASPRVLVLCPTRELAQQVAQEAIRLVRFVKGVRIANVVGGTPFGKQLMELRGAQLVVATPGRLLDLHRNGQIGLDCVQTLVVDEADRMLDLGFAEDLEAIHLATARRDRTLMFSATFAPRIMELASHVMREPQKIELATAQDTHENIEQRLHWFDDMAHKNALLEHYLQDETLEQAVVFTATQIETDELADELREAGYAASALHGAMPQTLRNRRIKAMRDGTIKVLIATDVAARGIDVPTITHVINYGLPMKPEDYVHRIGRTGRAGRSGLAITLAGFRDRFKIRNIEHFTQQRIGEAVVDGHEPRNKPPSTSGFGGGFGGGRGGYGGRGGDRGHGGGFGGGFATRGRFDRETSAGTGGYRGRNAGGGGFGGERSFDRAPADRPRVHDDRSQGRDFDMRHDAPRTLDGRSAARFERDGAPRESRLPRVENERSTRWGAARSDRSDRSDRFERPENVARPARFERALDAGRTDRGARPERSFGTFERRERDGGFGGDRSGFGRSDRDAPGARFDRPAPARTGFNHPFDAPFKRPQAGFEERGERAPRDGRGSFGQDTRGPFAHESRAQRRGDKPAGPAYTEPAEGGNRAARRAQKQAEYAARMAAQGDGA